MDGSKTRNLMTSTRHSTNTALRLRQFTMPKSSHTLEECEDAIGVNTERLRFAIADGATEAFDAGRWARQLASDWVQQSQLLTPEDLWDWLGRQGTLLNESWSELKLSWYSEEKASAGSFAAFVGVELDLTALQLRGIALGDSCFFQFRNGQLLKVVPELAAGSFTTTPILAPSLTVLQSNALNAVVTSTGELKEHDVLILCSDALAAWLLSQLDQSTTLPDLFFRAADQELIDFFTNERAAGRLKDDDVSLIAIEV
jgi:hypothetical protein